MNHLRDRCSMEYPKASQANPLCRSAYGPTAIVSNKKFVFHVFGVLLAATLGLISSVFLFAVWFDTPAGRAAASQ
jgi:hypothetical protein